MKVQKNGSRGLIFVFPDFQAFPQVTLTIQIYVIVGKKNIFICDTGARADQMETIKQYLKDHDLDKKPILVFNTHFHSDHTSGNTVFNNTQIVSHILCREKMIQAFKAGNKEDENMVDYKGPTLPSIVFQDRLIFYDDSVEFFYSPGHSEDSASCYDQIDKTLLVGDNSVDPLPLLTWHRFDKYIKTLHNYCDIDSKTVILGHNLILHDNSFIKDTLAYIEKFRLFEVDTSNFTPIHATWYRWSLIFVGISLKEAGKEEEAQKYFKKVKLELQKPELKPLDEEELKEIKEILKEAFIDEGYS